MKHKPYPKYINSGVEWLGEVPEHWGVKKFTYDIGFQEGPGIMAVDFMDEGIPLLRIRNIQGKTVDLEGCNFLDPEKVKNTWNHFRCKTNDLLISGSASTGLVCEVTSESKGAIPYTGIIRLWPAKKTIKKVYIRWLVSSDLFESQITIYQAGSTIKHFGPEHLRKMVLTLPPLPEQQAIATFLDRETERIDTLISKKKKLVELLKEKRTALISRAVTKGLDASVRLKGSGVEWLGDVPEHWDVKRLKYSSNTIMGQSPNSDEYSDDSDLTPFLQGNADFTDRFPTPRIYCETANKIVAKGVLLISVRAPVGALNEADQSYGIGRGLCAVLPKTELFKEYAWYTLQVTREELNTLATGSTYDAVSADEVGNMVFPLPPLPEQKPIAFFLDRETAKIDTLVSKVEMAIEKLKEHRTALISAAVTGKIDVREAV